MAKSGLPSIVSALPNDVRNFLQRVRESLDSATSGKNRFVTAQDLLDAYVVGLDGNYDLIPNNSALYDFSPPPAPTGLTASGALSTIMLEWDDPLYANLAYVEIWRASVDNLGLAVLIGTATGVLYSDPVDAGSSYYYWVRFVSIANIDGPYNAISGVHGTTSEDPTALLTILTGEITASQLHTALGTRIDLIDAAAGVAGSVAYRVAQEASDRAAAVLAEATARGTAITAEQTARQDGDDALATSISLLTAGVAGSFDAGVMWYFDSTLESWTLSGATSSVAGSWVTITSTGTNPQFQSPAVSISGAQYSVVKARIRRVAGSGWDGICRYTTSGHGYSDSYRKIIAAPSPFAAGDIAVIEFDMSVLDAGGTDWTSNTITGIKLDFGNTSGDIIEVDWIGIGRNAPGASVAALSAEQTARASGDSAEVTARQTLASQMTGFTDPTGKVLGDLVTGLLYEEKTTRTSQDAAISTSVTALSAKIGNKPSDFFVYFSTGWVPGDWTLHTGSGERAIVVDSVEATAGGSALQIGNNSGVDDAILSHTGLIPFDSSRTYRVRIRAKRTLGAGTISAGFIGVAADGVTLVSTSGANSYTYPHFVAAKDAAPATTYTEYTGYAKGYGATVGTSGVGTLAAPVQMHPLVRYLRPYFRAGYNAATGTTLFDYFIIDDGSTAKVSADLVTEQSTRASADTANATSITTLSAQVNHASTGLPAAFTSITNEASARASADTALATRATNLEASVNSGTTGLATKASVAYVDAAEASAISASATSIATVQAQLDVGGSTQLAIAAAQTQANTATTSAASAQTAADAANTLLTDIASDSKLTPVEKSAVRAEWDVIAAEKSVNNTQATNFSISAENTTYNTKFQALATYLNAGVAWSSGIPSFISDANLSATTAIVGSTFRSTFKEYYDARTGLLNAIATKAKTLADAAQATGNTNTTSIQTIQTVQANQAKLLNTSTANWVAGVMPPTGFGIYGTADKNAMVSITDGPFGGTEAVWQAQPNGVELPSGGTTHSADIPVDLTKTYRFITFTRRTAGSLTVGGVYNRMVAKNSGGTAIGLIKLDALTVTTNTDSYNSPPSNIPGYVLGQWVMYVGYINPLGTTTATLRGGVYDVITGNRLVQPSLAYNYAFQAGVTKINPQAFIYNCTDATVRQQFSPRMFFELCDGTERSVQSILADGGFAQLSAQYTVKLDVNGKVSGFGLASTGPTGTGSTFEIRADKFAIAAPTGAAAGTVPFVVTTTTTTINGVSVPAGTYIANAYISNGAIGNAQIGNLAVNDAKISALSVTKLTAGSITAGEYVRSTGYVAGTTGWNIDGNGNSEFSNTTVRGGVYASTGTFGTMTIASAGYIKLGQTAYNTGSGLWMGDVSGTTKFSLGVSGGNGMTWDGTNLSIRGAASGGNLLVNSGPFADASGWASGGTATNAAALYDGAGAAWRPNDGHVLTFQQNNATAGIYGNITAPKMPCVPSTYYELSVYSGAHRCNVDALVAWYNSAGTYISESHTTGNNSENGGGTSLASYKRLFGVFQAPATAVSAWVIFRKYATTSGQPDSWGMFTQAYFGQAANSAQTTPTPWSPGAGGAALSVYGGGTFSGALSAATGTFGAITIAANGNIKQGQTAYDTGTGFWLGDVAGVGKFSLGSSTSYLKWDGSSLTGRGDLQPKDYTPGAYVFLSNPALTVSVINDAVTYELMKKSIISRAGTLSLSVALYGTGTPSPNAAQYLIYKNGASSGVSLSGATSPSWATFTANLQVNVGDSVEIWGRGNSLVWANAKDFSLMCGYYVNDAAIK